MMSDLLNKRIAARQRIVECGGKRFTMRRPTPFEQVRYSSMTRLEYLCQFVDACDLTEADLFPDGSAEIAVQFDRSLLFDWIQEQPDMWQPMADALADIERAHAESLESAAKN